MAIPTLEEMMAMTVSEGGSYALMAEGTYDGVITNVEVRPGAKGQYLNIEWTCHDEDYRGRKVWRNSSFSEKALAMPGGIAELVQATKPEIEGDVTPERLPQALAFAVQGKPIAVSIEYEQAWKDGGPAFDKVTGEPIMREAISAFLEPTDQFVDSFVAEAAGVDDDLPF